MKGWTRLPCLISSQLTGSWGVDHSQSLPSSFSPRVARELIKTVLTKTIKEVQVSQLQLINHWAPGRPAPSCSKSADQADRVDPRNPEFTTPLSPWAPEFSEQFPLAAKPRLVKVEAWQSFDQCALVMLIWETWDFLLLKNFRRCIVLVMVKKLFWPVLNQIWWNFINFKGGYFKKWIISQKADIFTSGYHWNGYFQKKRKLGKLR